MYVGVAIWSAILGGGFYFARRFARAFERRRDNEEALLMLGQRLAALEESMEIVREDVERLDAGQDFTTRLLGSRTQQTEEAERRP
jgi:hypothetical protein